MKIPTEVKAMVATRRLAPAAPQPGRPACWKQLGELSRFHAHRPDGTCIVKNWSNSVVELRKV